MERKKKKTSNCIQLRYETEDKKMQAAFGACFKQIKMENGQNLWLWESLPICILFHLILQAVY